MSPHKKGEPPIWCPLPDSTPPSDKREQIANKLRQLVLMRDALETIWLKEADQILKLMEK